VTNWRVVTLTPDETHPVRLAVLRADTPTKEVRFAEDEWPGAVHLGAVDPAAADPSRLIATSSWVPREMAARPGVPAVQLRGMATLHEYQGKRVGAALIDAGMAHAASIGAEIVWANARDAALAFYTREGFVVEGDGFIDATTQLPHHVVVRPTG
jgi:GNAT superfamily N-acetyltransferase